MTLFSGVTSATSKICKTCGCEKSRSEFYANARMKDGLRSECKMCQIACTRHWQEIHFEQHQQSKRQWKQSPEGRASAKRTRDARIEQARERCREWRRLNFVHDRERKRISSASRRAQLLNQCGRCGICGQFIEHELGFHVDHVLPLARGGMHGYINVQPAHPFCNLSKGSNFE